MSATAVIRCPKCEKRFKAKAGVEGKKIRCPVCESIFVVPQAEPPKAKAPAAPPPIPLAEAPKAPEAPKPPTFDDDDDGGPQKYDVTPHDIQARCPNCANPLSSERDVVCTWCGYNLQTRAMGKTEKLIEHTSGERFMHLLPGFLCVGFIFFQTIGILYYCLVLPYTLEQNSWLAFTDHESMRMWTVITSLFDIWPVAIFAFNRLVLNPNPPPKKKD